MSTAAAGLVRRRRLSFAARNVTGTIPNGTAAGVYAVNVTNGFASQYGVNGAASDPAFGTNPTGEIYAFHPGGANAVFADGSVRMLSVGIEIEVIAALITRAGQDDTNPGATYLP